MIFFRLFFFVPSVFSAKASNLVLFIILYCMTQELGLAEEQTTPSTTQVQSSPSITPQIQWPLNLVLLAEQQVADENLWLEVEGTQALALKYLAKGKKFRGSIILVHGQGENPFHPQRIRPLSAQLSQLGWQVFIPSLPIADFPKKFAKIKESNIATTEKDTSTPTENSSATNSAEQTTALNQPSGYFKSDLAYQNFINQLIRQLVDKIQYKTRNIVIVGFQNAAYWILESTKQTDVISQVVLVEPEVPTGLNHNLEEKITGQFLPIHTFMHSNIKQSPFTKAFDRQLWRPSFQRFNRGLIDDGTIQIEDLRLSKTITGWIESINKKTKK